MPEPKGSAKLVGEVVPGVYRFTMHDNRIDSESDGYVVVEKDRAILIDPLPMNQRDLRKLGTVEAICLTASCHERAAIRCQRIFKIPVYAPRRAVDFEGTMPDRWYRPGDRLSGVCRPCTHPVRPMRITPCTCGGTEAWCSARISSRITKAKAWTS